MWLTHSEWMPGQEVEVSGVRKKYMSIAKGGGGLWKEGSFLSKVLNAAFCINLHCSCFPLFPATRCKTLGWWCLLWGCHWNATVCHWLKWNQCQCGGRKFVLRCVSFKPMAGEISLRPGKDLSILNCTGNDMLRFQGTRLHNLLHPWVFHP